VGQENARLFVRFYWSVMDADRNAFPRRRQKKVLLKSEIVPYVYKNKVERLDHSCRPISMENFEALDYHLQIKIAKFHGSWRFQAMVECYENIKKDRKDQNRLNEHLTFY